MSAWSVEELRHAALDALGTEADERARDALGHGEIALVCGVARWTSSHGQVSGHRVTLGLDASRLARLRAAPALVDALVAAFAAAIARRPGESLHDLALRWSPAAHARAAAYRDAPPPAPAQSLRSALVDYLDALGEAKLARTVAAARIVRPPRRPAGELHVVAGAADAERPSAREMDVLTRALRDLLGDGVNQRARFSFDNRAR